MPEQTHPDPDIIARARIDRARGGDLDALETLFRRHSAEVFRVAFHLTASRDDADDVVQDVFIGLPEALRGLADSASFAPWLRRVAARTALMRMRGERRRRQSALEDAVAARSEAGGEVDRIAIAEAIARLPTPLRVVFVLKEIEGYSHTEIAVLAGISVANSEVRLHRARRLLRAQLGG